MNKRLVNLFWCGVIFLAGGMFFINLSGIMYGGLNPSYQYSPFKAIFCLFLGAFFSTKLMGKKG